MKIRTAITHLFLTGILTFFTTNAPCLAQIPQKWTQSYTHRHYGIRDGLEQSQVYFIFQDTYGYMWFSTFSGALNLSAYHVDGATKIRTFGLNDGFDLIECGQNGASIDHEGYIVVYILYMTIAIIIINSYH